MHPLQHRPLHESLRAWPRTMIACPKPVASYLQTCSPKIYKKKRSDPVDGCLHFLWFFIALGACTTGFIMGCRPHVTDKARANGCSLRRAPRSQDIWNRLVYMTEIKWRDELVLVVILKTRSNSFPISLPRA